MDTNYYSNYGNYQVPNLRGTSSLATEDIVALIFVLVLLAVMILLVISIWKIFTKAGKPGWASLIPFYSTYVTCEIAGKEGWYMLLFFIPIVNFFATCSVFDGLSKNFGRTTGFTLGLIFFPIIFIPILAFSKDEIDEIDMKSMFQANPQVNTLNTLGSPVNISGEVKYNGMQSSSGIVNQNNAQTSVINKEDNLVNKPSMYEAPSFDEVPNDTSFISQNNVQLSSFNNEDNLVSEASIDETLSFNDGLNNTDITNQNDINQNNE